MAILLAAYANSFGLGLAQDSAWKVAQDSRIREASSSNLAAIVGKHYWWPLPVGNLYRPITTASLLFNYAILGNGSDAAGYHVFNFLLHLVNVFLVYALALQLFHRPRPAFFTAAIWGVHPVNVEAVANVVGRGDLLAAMSIFGGLLWYIRQSAKPGSGRALSLAAMAGIAAVGVFSKESAAVLVAVMLLWDIAFSAPSLKQKLARRWPYYIAALLPLVVFVAVRSRILESTAPLPLSLADDPLLGAPFWTARITALKIIGLDLWLALFPLPLASDRSYNQIPLTSISDPVVWLTLVFIALTAIFVLRKFRREPLWFWCAGLFLIALLPVSNLLFRIDAIMAERFLYVPSVALVFAAVALLYKYAGERLAAGSLLILTLLCGLRTFNRIPDWNSDLSLATADLRNAPNSARLHDMLALALFTADPVHNIDRVIQEQSLSCSILSSLPAERKSDIPLATLGMYYAFKSTLVPSAEIAVWRDKAVASLVQARTISAKAQAAYDKDQLRRGKSPSVRIGYPLLFLTLGNIYNSLQRYPDALACYRDARGIDPASLRIYDGLSAAYMGMGDLHMAAVTLEEKGLVAGPQALQLFAIGDIYRRLPGGSCAFGQTGNQFQLDLACPLVKKDLCFAHTDLAASWQSARHPERAESVLADAKHLGCE